MPTNLGFSIALMYLLSREASALPVSSSFTTSDPSKPSFLLTTGTGITLFTQGLPKTPLLSGLSRAVHLDYFYHSASGKVAVYWADTQENKIHRAFLIGSSLKDQEALVHHGVLSIQGIVVDWLSGNLYWLDSHSNRIEVCRWDGSMRTVLLAQVTNSSSLVLDPIAGYLFWVSENITNQVKNSVIERCLLDGSQRKTIVSLEQYKSYPSSLTLFTEMQELYWVDSQTGSLHSTDYNGQQHKVVGKSDKLSSAFSFVITKESIFWTDKTRRILKRASSQHVNQTDILTITYPEMFDLKLFYSRPVHSGVIDASCGRSNGGCSHLCLRGSSHSTCKCPYGLQLARNNKTCTDHGPVLGLVSPEATGHKITFVAFEDTSKQIFPPLKIDTSQPLYYAIDSNQEMIYRIQNRSIIREYLSGTPPETILLMDYFEPKSIALDYRRQNLYVLSRRSVNTGLLSVSQSSGNFLTHLHWKDLWQPMHLVLDIVHLKIFWSHVKAVENSTLLYVLETSGFDGTDREVFYHSTDPLHAITSDAVSKQLCWVNHNENSIICKAYDTGSLAHAFLHIVPEAPITVLWAYHGKLLYGNDLGLLQSFSLVTHNPASVVLNCTLNLLSVFTFTKDQVIKKVGGQESLCLPISSNQTTCNMEKVDSYITYVTGGRPHTVSFHESGESVELLPHALFQAAAGDSVDVVSGPNVQHYVWIDVERSKISSVRRDGKQQRSLVVSEDKLDGLGVDWISGNLYWSVPSKGQIWASNSNGQNPLIIYNDHLSHPSILSIQPEAGKLFWVSCERHCLIGSSSLSGANIQTLVRDLLMVSDLAVDGTFLYWSIPSLGLIERSSLQGRNKESFVGPLQDYTPLSIAVSKGVLYWADKHFEGGSILKQNGSELDVLRNDSDFNNLLFVVDQKLQGTNPCGLNNGGCSQLCLFSPGENKTCFCSSGYLNPNTNQCQDYSSFVILSNRNKVESVRLDNPYDPNPPRKPLKPSSDMNNLVALTYDSIQNRIYFNDLYQKPYLFSIHPNGSGFRPELPESKRMRHIEGLAFDPLQGLIIWTESTYPSIWTLFPYKSPQQIITLAANDKPRGIVVHQCTRQVFWTNWNPERPSIQTCTLGQCQKEHRTFLRTLLEHPNGLALYQDRIYWSESSIKTKVYHIQSCRLDATHCRLHIQGRDSNPFDLLVLPKQRILWTDFQNGLVCLADASMPNGCQPIRRGLEKPLGLALVGPTSDCRWTNDDESESIETFTYGCETGLCNVNRTSEETISPCNSSMETGNEYNLFHRNLSIIACVVGICLISATIVFIFIKYHRRKQRHWWQFTNPVTVECYCQREVPSAPNSIVNTSLLELNEVACRKQDDEQHLISSK